MLQCGRIASLSGGGEWRRCPTTSNLLWKDILLYRTDTWNSHARPTHTQTHTHPHTHVHEPIHTHPHTMPPPPHPTHTPNHDTSTVQLCVWVCGWVVCGYGWGGFHFIERTRVFVCVCVYAGFGGGGREVRGLWGRGCMLMWCWYTFPASVLQKG